MGKLKGLAIEEFSVVRGEDLTPANQEATVAFYKAQKKEKGSMAEPNVQQTPAPATPPPTTSLAKALGTAIRAVIEKAKTTRTSTYQSNSTSTDVWEEPDATMTEGGGEPTVIVIEQAAPVEKAAAAAGDEGDLAAAVEPIVKAINKLESRIVLVEKASAGSRAIAKGLMTGVEVRDNSDAKFGEFTKFLAAKSGLTAGQRLTKATLTSSGWSYGLSFHEAGSFIDYIVDQSVLLKLCRTVKMPDKKYNIDKIGLGGNVLVKGTPGTDPGDTVSLSGPTQVQLDAEEVIAIVSIGDDTLEDNIEGEAFVQHLLGMIARAAANELEQSAIHGDTAVADTGILDRWDGWYKLAKAAGAHVIDAMDDDDRYWPGAAASKATRLIKALPTKYRQDMRNLALLLAPDAYLDYNDMLATLSYTDAWASITGIKDLPVRGIKNVQVPMLKTDMHFTSGTAYTDGTVQILTDLRNLIFGIHREIKMEPYRQPRKRCTDYVLSMRAAVQIENGDAIAIYDHAKVK